MSLDNSSIHHPLPGDLQARVENALNLLTSLEAEEVRLVKVRNLETQKINALHEEKKSLEKQIETLKGEVIDLAKSIEDGKTILGDFETKISIANNELADINSEVESANDQLTLKKGEAAKRENDSIVFENSIIERHRQLEEKELAHQAKVEKLKRAIE